MKITLIGSLGHIGKPLTKILVSKGHDVTVISTNKEKIVEIESLGAKAAIGNVSDKAFLLQAFTGADLVYTMLAPTNYGDQSLDLMTLVENTVNNYKEAIRQAGVQRVVHLSSIGAHTDKGNGLLAFHHKAETILKQLPSSVHLTFMRPTGFYYNLFGYIGMIKSQHLIAANYGGEDIGIWVAPEDIAAAIAEEIESPSAGSPYIRYVASDELSCNETARLIGAAIGQPELKWILITDEQMLGGLTAMGMKPEIAKGMVEMYGANRTGILYEDYYKHRPQLGKIKMADFAPQFAAVYGQK